MPKKFLLTIPIDLHWKIKMMAAGEKRSMGNFINEAIKHSIEIREDYNHAKHNTKRLRSKDVL
mgnify:FL=1